ncbi:hypothetical protein QBC38DRAFT_39427 [Podospora fimiseda]|uniref:CFEM domain-containing protein n=1 Tax=Podospora fimiseda TaxID=252190 RepID=A0AAN7BVQ3_9PEZI|nr:hypothetical protein QBC38DRAFT_39427 [Podospora fimiseda]
MLHTKSLLYLLFQATLLCIVSGIRTDYKWSAVYNTSLYDTLPPCAQPCVAGVDAPLKCWSYGCVCSESSPGANFVDGTKHIQQCVRQACPQLGEAAVNNALNAFQSVCGVPYFYGLGAAPGPVTSTLTATISLSMGPTQAPTPLNNPVIIDKPDNTYDKLKPCVRWVINNCESPKDNPENCKPDKPGNHKDIWTGLGRYLQCSTAECVCGGTKFLYSLQKLYERADLYCSVGFPYQGADAQHNEGFKSTVKILADYCSTEGFIVEQWVVNVYGFEKEKGMSVETKTSIGVGVSSGVLTIISIVLAYLTLRKN